VIGARPGGRLSKFASFTGLSVLSAAGAEGVPFAGLVDEFGVAFPEGDVFCGAGEAT
jgi:hypothetical protein